MKVKELIRELKKMPQNLQVGISHHDNSEGEIAGWVCAVYEVDEIDSESGEETGKEVVTLQC